MWPGGLESRSYEWAIIGVFSIIRPFRDEIRLKLSFVSAVKNCIEQQELVTRHNKHDITAFHSKFGINDSNLHNSCRLVVQVPQAVPLVGMCWLYVCLC